MESGPSSVLGQGYTTCAFDREIVNFGTAESRLLSDYIEPLFRSQPNLRARDLTGRAAADTSALRRAIADLYADHFSLPNVDPDRLIFGSGITLLIERLGLALCDPGDIVLIPTPTYPFASSLTITGARVVYIDLSNLPEAPPPEAKMLIIANPGNPFGNKVANQGAFLAWAARSPHLHVIVDEVYALSNRTGEHFSSMAGRADANPERVHHLYGLSKDWCMAGVHVGIFWTRNKRLFEDVRDGLSHYRLSSCTNAVLTRIFGDKKLRNEMIDAHRNRLAKSEDIIVAKLTESGFSLVQSNNSLFVNIQIPECDSEDKEINYWKQMLTKYGVHILPGIAGFRMDNVSWFRLCFSHPVEYIVEGVERLAKGVNKIRQEATAPSEMGLR
jgi:aspartate/methionine/tyrosine aminotransferase